MPDNAELAFKNENGNNNIGDVSSEASVVRLGSSLEPIEEVQERNECGDSEKTQRKKDASSGDIVNSISNSTNDVTSDDANDNICATTSNPPPFSIDINAKANGHETHDNDRATNKREVGYYYQNKVLQ